MGNKKGRTKGKQQQKKGAAAGFAIGQKVRVIHAGSHAYDQVGEVAIVDKHIGVMFPHKAAPMMFPVAQLRIEK